jgi:hypothetical protein
VPTRVVRGADSEIRPRRSQQFHAVCHGNGDLKTCSRVPLDHDIEAPLDLGRDWEIHVMKKRRVLIVWSSSAPRNLKKGSPYALTAFRTAPENGFKVERMILCGVRAHADWFEVQDPLAVGQLVESMGGENRYTGSFKETGRPADFQGVSRARFLQVALERQTCW